MNILAISDLHMTPTRLDANRRGDLAPTLLRRAIDQAIQLDRKPDLIVILGDCIHDADPLAALTAAQAIRAAAALHGIPLLAVPGNHDLPPYDFAVAFDSLPGLTIIGGVGFFLNFDDFNTDGSPALRPDAAFEALAAIRHANPNLPLVALQHAPIDPDHPDFDRVNALYASCGVILSLSGHLHAGAVPENRNGTLHYTLPSVYRRPFPVALIDLEPGKEPGITPLTLSMPPHLGLIDYHAHTQFAYCARACDAAEIIDLSQAFCLSTQGFSEHACQLYMDRPYVMSFAWQNDPAPLHAIWQTPQRGRMKEFHAWMLRWQSPSTLVGLEVDLMGDGSLCLAPQDARGWDYLIAAVHEIPGITDANTQSEAEAAFMRDLEHFTRHPIDILAHPFRYFRWHKRPTPTHLYRPVAKLLAANRIAAEINFHQNTVDTEFFKICLEEGCKLALGTDAHISSEAAMLAPHLKTLAELGFTTRQQLDAILLQPDSLKRGHV